MIEVPRSSFDSKWTFHLPRTIKQFYCVANTELVCEMKIWKSQIDIHVCNSQTWQKMFAHLNLFSSADGEENKAEEWWKRWFNIAQHDKKF